jgi:hypothetical protein
MEKFICQKKGSGFLPFGDFSFLFRRRKRTEKQKRKPALRTYFANKDGYYYGRKWPGDIQNFSSARNYFLSYQTACLFTELSGDGWGGR